MLTARTLTPPSTPARLLSLVALALISLAGFAAAPETRLSYPLDTLLPRAAWSLGARGQRGQSQWDGRRLTLDFTQGADAILLRFPDRCLAGSIQKLRVTARGGAPGHPVTLTLRTHFMTFSKTLGEFSGPGERTLETDGPPGPGWTWAHGENDGKIHGPLRPGELRFDAGSNRDTTSLEIVSFEFEAVAPADRRVILAARNDSSAKAVRFAADLRAFSDQALPGTLRWVLRRWDGPIVTQGQRKLELPAGLGLRTEWVDCPALPKDSRFLEAEFTFEAADQKTTPVQAYWLAPIEPNRDLTLQPESPLGMGVYLNRFRGVEQEKMAQLAGAAGVKWSREDFDWGAIEPRRGEFRWDYHDRLVQTAQQNGITVYAIVLGFAPWTKAYTSEGVADYVRYLRVLVRHYRDRIHHWEIWNEPNIFFWQGPKAMYADLLIASYRAIKEEDPTAQVLGLSTAGIDFKFIDQMLAKQAPFDILTIHPYRKTLKDAEFIADLKKASDVVKLPDGRRRPVWITEMGWATHVPHHVLRQDFEPNSQRAQAAFLARTYLDTIASGVEPRTFWYDFRNDGEDPVYFEHNMGIVTLDGRPKPAYAAFATMTRVLRGQRFVRQRTDLGDVFAVEFGPLAGGPSRVLALWSAATNATAMVPTTARRATLVNTIGETQSLRVRKGACSVTLPAGAPVYLITDRP